MRWNFKVKTIALCVAVLSTNALASDFNLPFVNGADLGNMYSGWAASANDASTAFTNPAGLVKIQHPQLVFSGIGVDGSTRFTGTTTTALFPLIPAQTGGASSKLSGFIPTFYYSQPVLNNLVLAFNASAPFALGTNYNKDSIVRYAATRSQIVVLDVGPSIGFKINDAWSVGLGFDAARMAFTLNQMYGPPFSVPDAEGQNHLAGWGYGWHAGVLYQALPGTRLGLSFNSGMVFGTTGDSEVFMPTGAILRTTSQRASVTLPARTQLSIDQKLTSRLNVMGTVFYTNWSSLNQVILKNTMIPTGTTTPVTIPFQYHNTVDYSVGLNFQATPKWKLRTGAMFLSQPSNTRTRSLTDPMGGALILGVGAHYQHTSNLGFDLSYAHGFFEDTTINFATALSTATGRSTQYTNVFGGQVTWDIG